MHLVSLLRDMGRWSWVLWYGVDFSWSWVSGDVIKISYFRQFENSQTARTHVFTWRRESFNIVYFHRDKSFPNFNKRSIPGMTKRLLKEWRWNMSSDASNCRWKGNFRYPRFWAGWFIGCHVRPSFSFFWHTHIARMNDHQEWCMEEQGAHCFVSPGTWIVVF